MTQDEADAAEGMTLKIPFDMVVRWLNRNGMDAVLKEGWELVEGQEMPRKKQNETNGETNGDFN